MTPFLRAAAVLLLATACSRGSASTATPTFSPLPSVPADGRLWSLTQHFMNGGRTPPEEAAAVEQRVAVCMHAAHFDYEPVPTDNPTFFNTIGGLRRYRSTWGYGVAALPPDDPAARATALRNAAYRDRLPAEERRRYDAVLGVVPEGLPHDELPPPSVAGCAPQALREVRTGLPRMNAAIVRRVTAGTFARDPRYVAAVATWARCMRDRGYEFDHPDDPQRSARDLPGKPADRRRAEVALAVADVECYVSHVHPVQATLERELLEGVVATFPAYARFLPPR
jgi:hypothetical protein